MAMNMNQDSLILYKLITLYMLNRVNFPITVSQISDFILEHDYTNFLTLQQTISELTEAGMIHAETIRNRTHLSITGEGENTLTYFGNRLNAAIKEDIDGYLKEHNLQLRNEVSVLSDYYKSTSGEFEAHLVAMEKNISLIDITLSVPTENMASAICENWQSNNQGIYQYLMEHLL